MQRSLYSCKLSWADSSSTFSPCGSLLLRQARAAMDEVESWTDAQTMLLPQTYWPCLGVAAYHKAAIKQNPCFAYSRMPTYASSADLECEKRHVMCCLSHN